MKQPVIYYNFRKPNKQTNKQIDRNPTDNVLNRHPIHPYPPIYIYFFFALIHLIRGISFIFTNFISAPVYTSSTIIIISNFIHRAMASTITFYMTKKKNVSRKFQLTEYSYFHFVFRVSSVHCSIRAQHKKKTTKTKKRKYFPKTIQ